MRRVLTTEINKEKCNAAALGMFNASIGINSDTTSLSTQNEYEQKAVKNRISELNMMNSNTEISLVRINDTANGKFVHYSFKNKKTGKITNRSSPLKNWIK